MTKLAKQIKHNVKDMTDDIDAVKKMRGDMEDHFVKEVGQQCAEAGLVTPAECYQEYGDPIEPEEEDNDDDDFLGILSNANSMFREGGTDSKSLSKAAQI